MLAISKAHDRVFLYEPNAGLSVPLVLTLKTSTVRVEVPKVTDLNENFFAVESLEDVKATVPEHTKLIEASVKLSKFYSRLFETEIASNETTVAVLRELVGQHFTAIPSQKDSITDAEATGEKAMQSDLVAAAMVLG